MLSGAHETETIFTGWVQREGKPLVGTFHFNLGLVTERRRHLGQIAPCEPTVPKRQQAERTELIRIPTGLASLGSLTAIMLPF